MHTHAHRCRNISVLQSCLSKITLIREKDLDRARRYYEMLYLNDEVYTSNTHFKPSPCQCSIVFSIIARMSGGGPNMG